MPKKLTYKEVKSRIEFVEGYKLLSTIYKDSHNKLIIQCPEGHNYSVTLAHFGQGRKCPICARKKVADINRYDISYIKRQIEKIGYMLLSTEYINNKTKLKVQCSKGHIYYTNWDTFQSKCRCSECTKNKKLTYEYVKNYINSTGYKLISTEYINSKIKLEIQCNKGHKFEMRWNDFQSGKRCHKCDVLAKSGKGSPRWKNYTKDDLYEIENYKLYITKLSNNAFSKFYYKINPNCLKRSQHKYHLDHIYSVMDGFKNNVQPVVIANPNNLQMLWCTDNIVKKDSSHQTKKDLYLGYYKYKLNK